MAWQQTLGGGVGSASAPVGFGSGFGSGALHAAFSALHLEPSAWQVSTTAAHMAPGVQVVHVSPHFLSAHGSGHVGRSIEMHSHVVSWDSPLAQVHFPVITSLPQCLPLATQAAAFCVHPLLGSGPLLPQPRPVFWQQNVFLSASQSSSLSLVLQSKRGGHVARSNAMHCHFLSLLQTHVPVVTRLPQCVPVDTQAAATCVHSLAGFGPPLPHPLPFFWQHVVFLSAPQFSSASLVLQSTQAGCRATHVCGSDRDRPQGRAARATYSSGRTETVSKHPGLVDKSHTLFCGRGAMCRRGVAATCREPRRRGSCPGQRGWRYERQQPRTPRNPGASSLLRVAVAPTLEVAHLPPSAWQNSSSVAQMDFPSHLTVQVLHVSPHFLPPHGHVFWSDTTVTHFPSQSSQFLPSPYVLPVPSSFCVQVATTVYAARTSNPPPH